MDRAERRRLSIHKSRPAFCLGCGSILGRRGSPPAETSRDGYVHARNSCRSAAAAVGGSLRSMARKLAGMPGAGQ